MVDPGVGASQNRASKTAQGGSIALADGRVVILQCRPLVGQPDRDEDEVSMSELPVKAPLVASGGFG